MNWIVKKLSKQPSHDLELVAQGIDHAFFLFFLNSLLLLATMLIEAIFSIRNVELGPVGWGIGTVAVIVQMGDVE